MTDKLNYQIIGNGQVVEINLEPDKSLIADGGSLLYLDEEISFILRDNDGADEVKPDNINELEDSIEPEIEPDFTWNNPSVMSKVFDEPAEEEEKNEGLLEKLWQATKKTITRFGKLGEKKNNEEETESSFDWSSPASVEEEKPENSSEENKEPAFSSFNLKFSSINRSATYSINTE